LSERHRQVFGFFLKPSLAVLPAITLLTIIWAYGNLGGFGLNQVLALSLGMTGSMLVTNGFNQVASRRGAIYLGLEDHGAAKRFLAVTFAISEICVLVIAILAVLITSWFGVFTASERLIFAFAFVGLSVIWLTAGGLSLVDASQWLGIALASGLGAGILSNQALAQLSDLSLVLAGAEQTVQVFQEGRLAFASAVGFVVTTGMMFAVLRRSLNAKTVKGKPSQAGALPAAYLIHEALPYFAYGSLYTTLILLPHALGWIGMIANSEDGVWALSRLELVLTTSMLPLVAASGVAEHCLRRFWRRAAEVQATTPGSSPGVFGKALTKFYSRQLLRYLVALACISLLTYAAFHLITSSDSLDALNTLFAMNLDQAVDERARSAWEELMAQDVSSLVTVSTVSLIASLQDLPQANTMEFTFAFALIAYWLLGWGFFDCMFIISLAQPIRASRAVVLAIALTALGGIPASLQVNSGYWVLALVLGSIAFAALSFRTSRSLLRDADYWYFSSI